MSFSNLTFIWNLKPLRIILISWLSEKFKCFWPSEEPSDIMKAHSLLKVDFLNRKLIALSITVFETIWKCQVTWEGIKILLLLCIYRGCFPLKELELPCVLILCSSHLWRSGNTWYLCNRFLFHIQFSSVTQSCPTLCDPMNCSTSGLPGLPLFDPRLKG